MYIKSVYKEQNDAQNAYSVSRGLLFNCFLLLIFHQKLEYHKYRYKSVISGTLFSQFRAFDYLQPLILYRSLLLVKTEMDLRD